MSNQRVLATYSAPQSFQSSDNWKQIHSALLAQLPLRNIPWSSTSRPAVRTIQEIDITLVPLDTIRDERTSQIPVTVLDKPLLNVYFVACEVRYGFHYHIVRFKVLFVGYRNVPKHV
jgi:trafficking protein particle complex subunit 10